MRPPTDPSHPAAGAEHAEESGPPEMLPRDNAGSVEDAVEAGLYLLAARETLPGSESWVDWLKKLRSQPVRRQSSADPSTATVSDSIVESFGLLDRAGRGLDRKSAARTASGRATNAPRLQEARTQEQVILSTIPPKP